MSMQYSEVFNFRGPPGFLAAIAEAADRERLSQSEFARRAIIKHIKQVGVTPPATPRRRKRWEA